MKKILLTLAMLLGLTAVQAEAAMPSMLAPVWAAQSGISPQQLPTASLLDVLGVCTPERDSSVYSLFDDGDMKFRFNATVALNPESSASIKIMHDGVVVEEFAANELSLYTSTTSVITLNGNSGSWEPGTYVVTVPDGMFTVNGSVAEGMSITYTLLAAPVTFVPSPADGTEQNSRRFKSFTITAKATAAGTSISKVTINNEYGIGLEFESTDGVVEYLDYPTMKASKAVVTVTPAALPTKSGKLKVTLAAGTFSALDFSNPEQTWTYDYVVPEMPAPVSEGVNTLQFWAATDIQGLKTTSTTLDSDMYYAKSGSDLTFDLRGVKFVCTSTGTTASYTVGLQPKYLSDYPDGALGFFFSSAELGATLTAPAGLKITKAVFNFAAAANIAAPTVNEVTSGTMNYNVTGNTKAWEWTADNAAGEQSFGFRVKRNFNVSICTSIDLTIVKDSGAPTIVDFDSALDAASVWPASGSELTSGLGDVSMTLVTDKAASVNTDCENPVIVTCNGEEVVKIWPGDDAESRNDRAPYFNLMGWDEGGKYYTSFGLTVAEPGLTEPGTYVVTIPEGFVKVGSDLLGSYALNYTIAGQSKPDITFVLNPEAGSTIENFESFTVTAVNSETIKAGDIDFKCMFSTGDFQFVAFDVTCEGNVATFKPLAPITGNVTLTCMIDPGMFTADGGVTSEAMQFEYKLVAQESEKALTIASYEPALGTVEDGTDLKTISFKPAADIMRDVTIVENAAVKPAIYKDGNLVSEATAIAIDPFTYMVSMTFGSDPITAAGTYKVEVPKGVFQVSHLDNTAFSYEYIIPVPAPALNDKLVSVDPQEGVVNITKYTSGVGMIKVTYKGNAAVNPESKAQIALYKDGSLLNTITNEEFDIERAYNETAGETTFTFYFGIGTITDNGQYVVEIPSKKLTIDGVAMSAAKYEFVIAYTGPEWTVTPGNGETVNQLKEFTVTYTDLDAIYPVDNFMDFVSITYTYDEDGEEVEDNVVNNWTAEVKGNSVTFTSKFGCEPIGTGKLSVNITGAFTISTEENAPYAPAIDYLVYVKDAEPTYSRLSAALVSSDPVTGLISDLDYPDGVKKITLVFNGKVTKLADAKGVIELTTDGAPTIQPNDMVITEGENQTTIVFTFDNAIAAIVDLHRLILPDEYFAVNGVPAVGMKLAYNMEHNTQPVLKDIVTRIEPAQGVVYLSENPNGLGCITLYTTEKVKATSNNFWTYVEMYVNGELKHSIQNNMYAECSYEDPTYTGEPYVKLWFGDYEDAKQTELGDYRIVIPSQDFLLLQEDVMIVGEMTLNFTLKDKRPNVTHSVTPAEGEVEELTEITVSFTDCQEAILTGKATLSNGTETLELEAVGAVSASLNFVLPQAVVAPGVWTLNIPAGAVTTDGDVYNKNITASWTIPAKDSVNEILVANSYTVYSIDGACLMVNGSLDDVKTLAPGLYIVNGKKLLVRK